jgi:hypothetical protein
LCHSDLGDYAVGAHPDELEPISRQEADELSRLVMSIVEYLYVVPARVKRARDNRAL